MFRNNMLPPSSGLTFFVVSNWLGARGSVAERSRVRFRMRSLDFAFQPHYGPGVDSASNRNGYPRDLPGGKERPACKADNLTAICKPIV
jgi:hypothetical protein